MNKTALLWLRRNLERRGYRVACYGYRSLSANLSDVAHGLARFANSLGVDKIHLVGHSMGGMVILQMLEEAPRSDVGRIVLLGTPYQDSHPARELLKTRFGPWLVGKGLAQWLKKDKSKLIDGYEIGVVAGNRNMGLGQFIAKLPLPNDGTVAVKETQIPGMRDFIVLPITHTGMLFSPKVADQVCAFLKNGQFNQSAPMGSDS
jgi:pimeloyl-ACP methyl ester carboxylesterase